MVKETTKNTIVALDIETTDLSPAEGDIIEIAALKYVDGKLTDTWESLIKPSHPVPYLVQTITGITSEDLKDAPLLETKKQSLLDFIGDAPIVGHNIRFDIDFLAAKNIDITNPLYDTWILATAFLPNIPSHNLEQVAKHLDLKFTDTHRAKPDSEISAQVFFILVNKINELSQKTVKSIQTFLDKKEWYLKPVFQSATGSNKITAAKTKEKLREKPSVPTIEHTPGEKEFSQIVSTAIKEGQQYLVEIGEGQRRWLTALSAIHQIKDLKGQIVLATDSDEDIRTAVELTPSAPGGAPSLAVLNESSAYLSLSQFNKWAEETDLSPEEVTLGVKILIWLDYTQTGDLSELATTFEEKRYLPAITTRLEVLEPGSFWQKALEKAKGTNVIITSHDFIVENANGKQPLIPINHLLIDNAHSIEEAFTKRMTKRLSLKDVLPFLERLDRLLTKEAETKEAVKSIISKTTTLFGLLGLLVKNRAEEWGSDFVNLVLDGVSRSSNSFEQIEKATSGLTKSLSTLISQNTSLPESIISEAKNYLSLFKAILVNKPGSVAWLTVERQEYVSINQAPVSLSNHISKSLWSKLDSAVIFSPVIKTSGNFSYIKDRLGTLKQTTEITIAPNYNFSEQLILFMPNDMPDPRHPSFTTESAKIIVTAAQALNGRTVVLTTSKSATKSLYEKIFSPLEQGHIEVYAQGTTGGVGKTIKQFKDQPQSVLLATRRAWQHIDIPGANLSCLIIQKIPFDPPSDPLYQARQTEYENSFAGYALPRAIMNFRSGYNRLLRSTKDKGVVVILDSRLQHSSYAEDFIKSIPKAPIASGSSNELAQLLSNL